jgi:hypothetical protein
MSLTSEDYALLAKDAYRSRIPGENVALGSKMYKVFDSSEPSRLGFQATAYRSGDKSEVVIAYRGTEFDREPIKDSGVDAAMVLGGINPQDSSARSFTEHVIDAVRSDDRKSGVTTHISVTGHSLGGTLAELNAGRFGLDGQTFNAYGAKGLDPHITGVTGRLVDHARAGDPVSAANPHLGVVKIYASQKDVDRIGAAGYDHHDRFNNLRTALAVDFSSHGIENFVPNNEVLGNSILSPEAEARYRGNRELIDSYRSDISVIRSHASVAWEAQRAVTDHVERAGHYVAESSLHAGQAVAADVARGAIHAYDGARALGMTPDYAADARWGSRTGSPELDRLLHPPKLTEPGHPDHAMFQQALHGVHAVDASTGRKPDQMSENLAGALTVEARRNGLTRIDHVEMNTDYSRAYAVQGDTNSPFKKFAEVPTEVGIATSIEHSSMAWQQAAAQDTSRQAMLDQTMAQSAPSAMPSPPLVEPTPGR